MGDESDPEPMEQSDIDIFLSGSRDAIVMVEGGAQMVPEEEILEALFAGHEAIQPSCKSKRRFAGRSVNPKDKCRSPN